MSVICAKEYKVTFANYFSAGRNKNIAEKWFARNEWEFLGKVKSNLEVASLHRVVVEFISVFDSEFGVIQLVIV